MAARVRVAVFVDGENLSASYSGAIVDRAKKLGTVVLCRAYGNAELIPAWDDTRHFQLVHAGRGKNATDLLLAIDAVDMACAGSFDTVILGASDGDYVHLARRLRERGLDVYGLGEAKAPHAFRAACTSFEVLGATDASRSDAPEAEQCSAPSSKVPTADDRKIRKVIARISKNGDGALMQTLGTLLYQEHEIRISERPEGTWRRYFERRHWLYELDPAGPHARVRFRREGFFGIE